MKDNFKKTIIGTNAEPPRNYIGAKDSKFYEYLDGGIESNLFDTIYIPVEQVELNKHRVNLRVGKSTNLVSTVIPENSTEKVVTGISSNPEVASVSCSGRITSKSKGIATIYSSIGGKCAICEVVVEDK